MVNVLPDAEYFDLVRSFMEARDAIKRENEMRRLASNAERVTANKRDAHTNLVIEEANEQLPFAVDYEPVQPEPEPEETEPGD